MDEAAADVAEGVASEYLSEATDEGRPIAESFLPQDVLSVRGSSDLVTNVIVE